MRDSPIPRHVGIILDGNRRFARKWGLESAKEVYRLGAEKLEEVLDWCDELGIVAVTLWVCSTDNLSRPPEEVSGILNAVEGRLMALLDNPEVHRRRIRIRAAGRLELLPVPLIAAIRAAEAATADYSDQVLTIAVAYSGREEIADAVKRLVHDRMAVLGNLESALADITPEAIGRYVYTADLPDPDLIIRTSGEIRLSGFLLWQSAYSEYYFSDVYWPAFRKIDFLRAIRSFQQRRRRFGQ